MEDFNFKKKFGQNFLKDVNIVRKIANTASITSKDLVIEVGPGKGILTKELAKLSKKVVAYEIDTELADYLNELKKEYPNIEVIYGDFIKSDIFSAIKNEEYENIYFVSNVPYYITTPILMKIMDTDINFNKIVMMVQKEVGNRFSAKPKTKEYNSLTVYLNYFFDIKKEFVVNRKEFTPVPNVDSVVVSFTRKKELFELNDKNHFFKLVRDSFQYKRKTIRNNLKGYDLELVDSVLKEYNFSLSSRAEELPVIVFVKISNALTEE